VDIPVQSIVGAVPVIGGLLTAWVGPDATDEDNPTGELSPRKMPAEQCSGLGGAVDYLGLL
jgi:hypothetical protein